MKLGHIELFCRDTSITSEFLTKGLGFEIVVAQPGGFVWLQGGSIEILLRPNLEPQVPANSYQTALQALVIYTSNPDEASSNLKAAGVEFKGTDGSPECLTFQDPDGRWYQLVAHP